MFRGKWIFSPSRVKFETTTLHMKLSEFKSSLTGEHPPRPMTPLLQALWYDHKGNWQRAHEIAQEIHSPKGSWIHAYLHRKEGDSANAGYWYHMAERPFPTVGLDQEWEQLVAAFAEKESVIES